MKQIEYIENNYPLFKNGTSNREIRHNFFSEIKTELQSYLLGFIAADGSINDERHTLQIHINEKDQEIFTLFKIISPNAYTQNCKGYESKALVKGCTVKNSGSIRLSISSKILIEDLHKLGIVERKTYHNMTIPKQIPKDLIIHFIRGYFDGDGCITYSIRKPNIKNREKNYRVTGRFEICAKTSSLLLDFQQYLKNTRLTYIKRDDMYRLETSSKKCITNIFNLLYSNSNWFLSRKFEKFNHYVNTEVTQLIAEYRNAQEVNVNESNNPPKSVEIEKEELFDDDWYANNYFDYL